MAQKVALVYPHQLFEKHPAFSECDEIWLVEEPLFFSQFNLHRKKLILHRASILAYEEKLKEDGRNVRRITSDQLSSTEAIAQLLKISGSKEAIVVDLCDDWLSSRLTTALASSGIYLTTIPDPYFLTPLTALSSSPSLQKPRWFFTSFYKEQRIALNILLEEKDKPVGGAWSFDTENRKRLPANLFPPKSWAPRENKWVKEARESIRRDFPNAIGMDDNFNYPITHHDAREQLREFLENRLPLFGDFEDAISIRHSTLFHSVLTPALNIGLISPREIVDEALKYQSMVPINSLEGFIRQIIGWREYVRLVYLKFGRVQRTKNALSAFRDIPEQFYTGQTGLAPVDHVINQLLETGYCHHIERLMILGNIMCLCRIHPDNVYRWFMEFFVDSYDWVMVPNIYGMSQYADGGLMTTKPYVSGSSYIKKMSDFKAGSWCDIWDSLYWSFVADHRPLFETNPRSKMLCGHLDKMKDGLKIHRERADKFLCSWR